jgi:predicted amidophosphoribosyltransferase
MPFSLGQTADTNEIECPRCGEIFHFEYSRCPNCGLNLYEPNSEFEPFEKTEPNSIPSNKLRFFSRLKNYWKQVTGQKFTAEEVFGASLDQAFLFNDLLQRVGGDHQTANRLIQYEYSQKPKATRRQCIQSAIDSLAKDQRSNKQNS